MFGAREFSLAPIDDKIMVDNQKLSCIIDVQLNITLYQRRTMIPKIM